MEPALLWRTGVAIVLGGVIGINPTYAAPTESSDQSAEMNTEQTTPEQTTPEQRNTERSQNSEQARTGTESDVKLTHQGVHVAQGEQTDLILDAKQIVQRFTGGESPRISQQKLREAECVVIFPQVTRAALVVGGQHGDGVVTCRGEQDREWSRVGFVDLRGASLGAQIGVDTASVIMLLKSEQAKDQLQEGRMRFDADVSYVFGDREGGAGVSSDRASDVEIFSDSEGAFASASLQGSYIAADDEELREFYRDEISTLYSALSARPAEESHAVVRELLILLPSESAVS